LFIVQPVKSSTFNEADMTKIRWMNYAIVFTFGFLLLCSCSKKVTNQIKTPVTTKSEASSEEPYLLLISLDGFRWDYVEKYNPPHLSDFIKNGVKAESLIPSFPSKTFPNHYTIATGMYPDKHGLLSNNFYSNEKDVIYNIRDRTLVEDGEFYGGTPIWVQAAKSGMVTASYFFVGTEADIQGIHPTYYHLFDGSVKKEDRVHQALNWLNMPDAERPHLITMYFADLDNTGHRYGPNEDLLLQSSLLELDTILGSLFEGIKDTGLPVNIIIVSDHGMKEIPLNNFIPIEKISNDELFLTINNGSIVNIHPINEEKIDSTFQYLKDKEENFKVYKTTHAPYFEYTPVNKNWGAIQVIPDETYYFSNLRGIGMMKSSSRKVFGQHGFDPLDREMHGIFYANGPAFKKGHVAPSIKNIHVFPLMCKILKLEIPENIDGRLDQIESMLQLKN
jgi:predicted AlkP superfamily pyrophosphatase or phosphodiesterase